MKSLPKESEVEGVMEARTELKSQISRQVNDGGVESKDEAEGRKMLDVLYLPFQSAARYCSLRLLSECYAECSRINFSVCKMCRRELNVTAFWSKLFTSLFFPRIFYIEK